MKTTIEADGHPEVRRSCNIPSSVCRSCPQHSCSFSGLVRDTFRATWPLPFLQFSKLLSAIFADVERLACLQAGNLAGVQRATCFEVRCGHARALTSTIWHCSHR